MVRLTGFMCVQTLFVIFFLVHEEKQQTSNFVIKKKLSNVMGNANAGGKRYKQKLTRNF